MRFLSPLTRSGMRVVLCLAASFSLTRQPAAGQSRGGLFEGFDTGYQGWAANKGKLSISSADVKEGSGALAWRFDYVRDAIFLFTRSRLDRFAAANGVAIWLKSDRDGPVFLRFDQRDGSPFIALFTISRDWNRYNFRFDEFQPAGRARRLDPAQLSAFYLVDLGGKDNNARGSRTIWVDGIEATGGASAAAPAQAASRSQEPPRENLLRALAGARPQNVGRLVLKSWSGEGAPLTLSRMKDNGSSGGEFLFASDLDGLSRYGKVAGVKEGGVELPVLETDSSQPVAINVLFWTVPGYGRVWLRADNAGAGYRGEQILHLNYELARSRLGQLERKFSGGFPDDGPSAGLLAQARRLLDQASRESGEVAKARLSDESLAATLRAADGLELALARREIERARKGDLTVVVTRNGRPVRNCQVNYAQTRSDTLFGCIQSFGFIDQKVDRGNLERIADLMREAGFNHFTVSLFWDRTEPKRGQENLDEWDRKLGLDAFSQRGFTFTAHAIVQSALPDYVKRDGAPRFIENATAHLDRLMRHYMSKYPGSFRIWQAVNEPSSNRYVGLDTAAKEDMIAAVTREIRRNDPKAFVLVNDYDWDRGQRHKANLLQADVREMYSSYEFYQMLNQRGVPYDLLGLQWYPGLRVFYGGGLINLSEPLMDFGMTSAAWDRYARLGKPVHLTEMAVPGTSQRDWKNGYWHAPWNGDIQAEYMRNLYTVAFSKPYIGEITYWGISDHEPWAIQGGMLDSRWQPKPLYSALKELLQSWTTRGSGQTDAAGRLTIRGFAGKYEIELRGEGASRRVQAHIRREASETLRVEL